MTQPPADTPDANDGSGAPGASDTASSADADVLLAKRRRRTEAYLSMWGVHATIPVDVLRVPHHDVDVVDASVVRGRALASCVMALRGQGLSQREAFAFADAYSVWEHLTLEEDQFLLTDEPSGDEMLQAAWRYERLWVHLWALGHVRHLAFSDNQVDSATALEICVSQVALAAPSAAVLRDAKDLLDAADIAWCSRVVAGATSTPMQQGVVHERAAAFDELLSGWRPSAASR